VAIRFAGQDDRAAVERIVQDAYSVYVPVIGSKPRPMLDDYRQLIGEGFVHVLEIDGTIAGLIVLIPEADGLLLDNVAIRPADQHKGYGRALIAFAEDQARMAGYNAIKLLTNEAMARNLAIYRRLGFVETHRSEEASFRRVFMTKALP
jgi:GNAT superfamily N-acetyltransferase